MAHHVWALEESPSVVTWWAPHFTLLGITFSYELGLARNRVHRVAKLKAVLGMPPNF